MNNIIVMAFTAKGHALAEKIAEILTGALSYSNYRISAHRVSKLKEFVPAVFQKGNILVFIGAAGIAVRAISKLLNDKTTDPAVIVVDELGRYVIPILSGHIGGANAFAEKLSSLINAVPVITTATDINNVFSIDAFAAQNNYLIVNPECIKHVSSALLNGNEVGLATPFEICGELPKGIVLKPNTEIGVLIDIGNDIKKYRTTFTKTLHLMPKCFHVGVGARKNICFEALNDYFLETLSKESIPASCVASISSIDLKKSEPAIIKISETYRLKFLTYSAEQLKPYAAQFEQSEFVLKTTGIGNVCETSAYVSSQKGEIVVSKRSKNGMAIAVAKEAWRVVFGNTDDRA